MKFTTFHDRKFSIDGAEAPECDGRFPQQGFMTGFNDAQRPGGGNAVFHRCVYLLTGIFHACALLIGEFIKFRINELGETLLGRTLHTNVNLLNLAEIDGHR